MVRGIERTSSLEWRGDGKGTGFFNGEGVENRRGNERKKIFFAKSDYRQFKTYLED